VHAHHDLIRNNPILPFTLVWSRPSQQANMFAKMTLAALVAVVALAAAAPHRENSIKLSAIVEDLPEAE